MCFLFWYKSTVIVAIIAHINGCLFKKYYFAAKKLFFVKQNATFAALLAIKQTLASLPCSIKKQSKQNHVSNNTF